MADETTTTSTTGTEAAGGAPSPAPQMASLLAAAQKAVSSQVSGGAPAAPAAQPGAEQPPAQGGAQEGAPPAPAPTTGDPALDRSYQDLMRRDRELNDRRARLAEEERSVKGQLEEYHRLREIAPKDPIGAFRALGLDRSSVLDAIIAADGQQDEPAQKASEDIRAVHQKMQALEQRLEQRDIEHGERTKIDRVLAAPDPEGKYELTRMAMASGADVQRDILNLAAGMYNDTKRIPQYQEVVDAYEEKLTREAFSLMEALTSAKKVSSKFALQGKEIPAAKETPPKAAPGNVPVPRTLTNDMQAVAPKQSIRQMTQDEMREEFNKAVKAMWKKEG